MEHRAAVKNDGTLWTWGSNGFGQLGNGQAAHKDKPVLVMSAVKTGNALSTQGQATRRSRNRPLA
ncbi:MAG: hypothetical protein LBK98_07380 [Peptococcaceae bacterium]|nr:hypothetical protein [Peptococcaceae bacterium]